MGEFAKVIKDFDRMCNNINCGECTLKNDSKSCGTFIRENPEDAEKRIAKWAAEHPIKTNRMRFKEVFGFDYTDEFCATYKETEWLNAEYKGGQNENQSN